MSVAMKWIFGIVLLLGLVIPQQVYAKGKSLVVLGAYKKGISERAFQSIISDLKDVLADEDYEIPDDEDMDDTLDEDLKDTIDEGECTNLDCLVKVGGAMGVDWVLAVSVVKKGDHAFLNVVLADMIEESVLRAGRTVAESSEKDAITAGLIKLADAVLNDDLDDDVSYEASEDDLFEPAEYDELEESEEEEEEPVRKKVYSPEEDSGKQVAARVGEEDEEDEEDNFIEEEPAKEPTFFTYAKWTSLGLTVVSGGMIVFTGLMAKHYESTYNDSFEKYHDFDMQAKADADNYALATNVLIGVTSGLAAATVTFFILDWLDVGRDAEQSAVMITPSVGSDFAGASVQVRF